MDCQHPTVFERFCMEAYCLCSFDFGFFWPTSCSRNSSKLLHVTIDCLSSLLSTMSFIGWMYCNRINPSIVDGHLGNVQSGAHGRRAAVNSRVRAERGCYTAEWKWGGSWWEITPTCQFYNRTLHSLKGVAGNEVRVGRERGQRGAGQNTASQWCKELCREPSWCMNPETWERQNP